MKKVLSSIFTLMLFVSLTNATTAIEKTATFEKDEVQRDCHHLACTWLSLYELEYDLSDSEADSVYGHYLTICEEY